MILYKKLLLVSIIFLIGCDKVIYIPLDDGELKIVVSGIICPDSTCVVAVTSSRQMIEPDPNAQAPDSMLIEQISLFEDDNFIGNMDYLERVFYTLPGFKPSIGKAYRIEVSAQERKSVQAITTIPESIPITYLNNTLTTINSDTAILDVEFKFTDPIDETNYYALDVSAWQNYWNMREQVYTDSMVTRHFSPKINGKDDEMFDLFFLDANRDIHLDQKLFFSDQIFNGRDFTIKFSIMKTVPNHRPDSALFRVKLQHVDPSYYHYAVSEQKYRDTRNNPFTEPVQVYSNIQNGYGLFSSYSETVREFKVFWVK